MHIHLVQFLGYYLGKFLCSVKYTVKALNFVWDLFREFRK